MKRLSHLAALLLTLAMLLSLVSIAHAEEKQSATAWLLYFASNHETDSSKFPWWPQHKSADQPSSETGVEAISPQRLHRPKISQLSSGFTQMETGCSLPPHS